MLQAVAPRYGHLGAKTSHIEPIYGVLCPEVSGWRLICRAHTYKWIRCFCTLMGHKMYENGALRCHISSCDHRLRPF